MVEFFFDWPDPVRPDLAVFFAGRRRNDRPVRPGLTIQKNSTNIAVSRNTEHYSISCIGCIL